MTDYFVSYLTGGGEHAHTQHSYGSVVVSLPRPVATKEDIDDLTNLLIKRQQGRPSVILNIIPLPITPKG